MNVDLQDGLSLLFQRGLELALRIQQDAMEAEQPETRAKLATAFHRISRSVRQTAALKLRLEREAKRAVREDQAAVRADRERQVDLRKTRIKARVEKLIWTEYEGEDADRRESILEDLLDADALEDDFLDLSPEAEIARLCMDLGLPSPPAGEGGGRSPTDEGSMIPSTAARDRDAFDAAPLLPQGEKDDSG
ncbi:flotillin family protein [Phenylobacterium soli]|uniref:Uncharacterized protein n=1 Tax=Phenylobacterium soli TaxID=2170551 RepID=A0A328AB76_9CAUL|nr:hypothetical protein [Phenylobacterium soli]RAK51881.1 hypothetical protein DJ017_18890 [Phenylobacterium soli]